METAGRVRQKKMGLDHEKNVTHKETGRLTKSFAGETGIKRTLIEYPLHANSPHRAFHLQPHWILEMTCAAFTGEVQTG